MVHCSTYQKLFKEFGTTIAHHGLICLKLNSEIELAKQRFIELVHGPVISGFNFSELTFEMVTIEREIGIGSLSPSEFTLNKPAG